MRRLPPARSILAMLALAALCIGAAAQQGCYQRVVGARGLGASNYEISQPYQENSKVDDWVFGQKPTNDRVVRPKMPE